MAKKLPPQRYSKPLFIAFFNFSHKWPTFAFTGESGYTLGSAQRIAHKGLHAETGAFPPSSTAGLCAACEIALSAAFVTLIPQRFYIHTFPGSLWPPTISNSSTSDHLSSRFSTSPTNGPRLLSQAKVRTHSAFGEKSHTTAHRAKQGCFGWGRYLYPLTVLRGPETLRGQGVERQTLPLWDLGREVLSKNAESLRDSDALMRVAVPRRRGPAGLRDLFRFCRSCGLYALRSGPFRVCEARGGITTLSALCVLLKRRTAACQNGSFAVL